MRVDGVGVRFKDRLVLDGVDLRLEPGRRLALHGPNGSGKSTLLRCIAGTVLPSTGTVLVGDAPAHSVQARAVLGSVLASERSFALRLSGLDNLRFAARLRVAGGRAAERAVQAVVDELELGSFAARRTDRCSTGMLQQLAFARALLGDPACVLLDEPTRSMDAGARERMWAALGRRPALAVVIASHDDADLARCDARHGLTVK